MIYSYDTLATTLRSHCGSAKHRVWICTPFIGGIKDVLRIISGSWKRSDIDFRVITDIETGFMRQDTFDDFIENHPNSIRTLKSLHAKIYIVDDWCLVSSANLTGTAFSKRYEIGTDDVNISEMETFFNSLWENKKTKLVTSWSKGKKQSQIEFEDGGVGYDKLTNLPTYSAGMEKWISISHNAPNTRPLPELMKRLQVDAEIWLMMALLFFKKLIIYSIILNMWLAFPKN